MKFIIKRLTWMLPTFFGITILVFYLLSLAPHDPVDALLSLQGIDEGGKNYEEAYNKQYYNMGLNMPIFYISIVPNYFPKNLNLIASKRERQLYDDLLKKRINHELIENYLNYSFVANRIKNLLVNKKTRFVQYRFHYNKNGGIQNPFALSYLEMAWT